ncbi:hypothetical protein HWA77_17045 [Photobacterium damselae subsp. damselae]|uniref:Lipoprotein n=1 Tax=Photobacterium damselae subsp. damselae TaxID=85581 RepID=A0A850QVQ4_PHODD|nr:hypothetical protein [Photobacterium damselae subsp. damselae]
MKKLMVLSVLSVLVGCAEQPKPVYDPQVYINEIKAAQRVQIEEKAEVVKERISGAAFIAEHDAHFLLPVKY